MQKTEYGYRRAVRIGIICLIFALCMGKYVYGSVVVDEVLIGGQEESAPSDAAPAVQASAEPDASEPPASSKLQAEPDASEPPASSKLQAEPDVSQPVSEAQTKPESQSTSERQAKTAASHPVSELDIRFAAPAPSSKVTGTPRPDTEAPGQEKSTTPVSNADGMETDPGQPKVPAEPAASVSANDRQQFHVPNQETQTNGDKTAKSGNSSGKNGSGKTAKQERKAQEQPSVWQDTAETTGKEKTEGGKETEEKTGGPLLPGFILLCIVMLLAGSICLIRDNNIDLKK